MTSRMRRARDARGLIKRCEIEALARRIWRQFKPIRIVLFGSYAWGRPNRESDIDLFLEMPTRRDYSDLATEIRCAVDPAFPLDIVIRTSAELRSRLAQRDSFICDIVERGKVLHAARHARVG